MKSEKSNQPHGTDPAASHDDQTTWYRVFGTSAVEVTPNAILSHLEGIIANVTGSFRGDDAGWFEAEIRCTGTAPIVVQRFLATDEGIRPELNAWAAYVETCDGPNVGRLMEHVIQTKQLYTICGSGEGSEKLCLGIARFLARTTDGVFQVDGQGVFDSDGVLILQEH